MVNLELHELYPDVSAGSENGITTDYLYGSLIKTFQLWCSNSEILKINVYDLNWVKSGIPLVVDIFLNHVIA